MCPCPGPKLGLWMVLPSQLIVMVGLGIAYTVTGGSSLSRIYHLYTNDGDTSFGLSCWILIFMACQLMLSQVGFPTSRAASGRQTSMRGRCAGVDAFSSSYWPLFGTVLVVAACRSYRQ